MLVWKQLNALAAEQFVQLLKPKKSDWGTWQKSVHTTRVKKIWISRIRQRLLARVNKSFLQGRTQVLQYPDLETSISQSTDLFVVKELLKAYMASPSFAWLTASRFSSRTFLLFCTPLKILSASVSIDLGTWIFWRMEGLLTRWCSGGSGATGGFFV